MGRACGEHAYKKEMHTKFLLGNLKAIHQLEIMRVDGSNNTKVELKYS